MLEVRNWRVLFLYFLTESVNGQPLSCAALLEALEIEYGVVDLSRRDLHSGFAFGYF